jgi:RHS repeat-associated protein
MRYRAWGTVRYGSGNVLTTFRYTGQRLENSLGLYFYQSRWYDPYLNRWIQPDTIIPEASQGVQAWDRYAYANNNPVIYNDPSGHCVFCALLIFVAIVTITASIDQIEMGSLTMAGAAQTPEFSNEQEAMQDWQNNCMGQCHYAEAAPPVPEVSTGPMPDTPQTDTYSNGMADIAYGIEGVVLGVYSLTTVKGSIKSSSTLSSNSKSESLAVQTLRDLTGKSQAEVSDILSKAGFKYVKTTKGGYRYYTHSDGSQIWIGPNGRIVRLGARVWNSDGTQKYNPRYNQYGVLTQVHDTGEYIAK